MTDWSRKRVLVTGAGGFIGSHLTERLIELGAETHAFVRYTSTGSWGWLDHSPLKNDARITLGDIRDHDIVSQVLANKDVVFHLAALIAIPYSYHAPLSYVQTNVEGTLNVLQAAQRSGSKVIHTSTSEVYGTAMQVPISESHPLQGQSPYSASKIGADKIAESFYLSFGLPVVTVRPFNTFGPRQSARAVIPTIVTQVLTESKIRLGNLAPTRDLNYVSDTVSGFIRAAESPNAVGEVINLGSGTEISIGELAALILHLMGKDIPITVENERVRPENSEVERLCADSGKARELLDWTPQYSLAEGLKPTIEWIKQNNERYRRGAYVI